MYRFNDSVEITQNKKMPGRAGHGCRCHMLQWHRLWCHLTPGRVPAPSRAGTGDGLHQSQCLLPSLTPGGGTLVLVLLGSSAKELGAGVRWERGARGCDPKGAVGVVRAGVIPMGLNSPARLSNMHQLYPEHSVFIRLIRGTGLGVCSRGPGEAETLPLL